MPTPDLGLVDPDHPLAVFGTFNPVGPTLNVLGALGLADGRYLLASWMRHPFSPAYTALLVLPDLEPATVRDALMEVLPSCGVPAGTEFAGTYGAPEVRQAVGEAFKQAAANAGELEELWGVAHALEDYRGEPWSRVSGGGRAAGALPADPAEVVTPGLLTWCENRCEVCELEEPQTRLVRHVFPVHSLEGIAALHNYLASILTRFPQTGRKRFQ